MRNWKTKQVQKTENSPFILKWDLAPYCVGSMKGRGKWELVELPRRVRARANCPLQKNGSTEDSKVREATIRMYDILTYGNHIKSWSWLHIYTRWLTMLWHLPLRGHHVTRSRKCGWIPLYNFLWMIVFFLLLHLFYELKEKNVSKLITQNCVFILF